MKGYVVIDAEIINAEAYSDFAAQSSESIAAHGGRVLARSSNIQAVQGDWAPKRLVIVEFDSPEAARGYIDSPEYAALDEARRKATKASIVVVGESDS